MHKTFLLFFAGLGLGGLAVQTLAYGSLIWGAGPWELKDAPFLFRVWFYGLDFRSLFGSIHIDGAWPSLLLTLIAYVGSKLPAKTGNLTLT